MAKRYGRTYRDKDRIVWSMQNTFSEMSQCHPHPAKHKQGESSIHEISTTDDISHRKRNLLCGEMRYHGTTDSSYCCRLRYIKFSFLDTESTKSSASAAQHVVHRHTIQATSIELLRTR